MSEELINLASLLNGADDAVAAASERLTNDGFCFLSLSSESHVSGRIQAAVSASSAFFSSSEETKANSVFGDVGYAAVPNAPCPRQCLRLVSGRFFTVSTSRLPDPKPFANLAVTLDLVTAQLTDVLSPSLFGCEDLGALAEKVPLPLIATTSQDTQTEDDTPGWGLLDVVLYENGTHVRPATVVVSEHADPGLLAIEVYESAPGMEFRDRTGSWQRTPPGAMALWTGSAAVEASDGTVKPGWHRVAGSDSGTPRLAIWHEVATISQLSSKSLAALSGTTGADSFVPVEESVVAHDAMIKFTVKTLTGRKTTYGPFYMTDTYLDLKEKIQVKEGIPPSKNRLLVKGPKGLFVPDDSEELGKQLRTSNGEDHFLAYMILTLRG